MTEQLKAVWKNLLSYTKKSWDIDDYPLRYKKQADTNEQNNIGELKPWVIQIINWWTITGLGNTKEEAYQHLKQNFTNYLEHNQAPRPGTNVPLVFVDSSQIAKLEDVAPDFFEKILDIDYFECFISDESSLSNFGVDDEETLDKINSIYNLQLTDLGDGKIVRLLNLIKDRKDN